MPFKLCYVEPPKYPIREGRSEAMYPDRISALDLPAELRNHIYAMCLEFADPLKIGGNDVGRLYRHNGDRNTSLRRFKPHKKDTGYFGMPAHVMHPGRDLFLTCHQIYHESASYFFGMNEFHITERHESNWPSKWKHENFDEHHQDLIGGLNWLSTLGSQLSMLRRVVIDVNTLRPKAWQPRQEKLWTDSRDEWRQWDFLPLVRFMWSRGDDVPNVLLVHPFNQDERLFDREHLTHRAHLTRKEMRMNKLLQRLCIDDLDIERQVLLISTIGLDEDAKRGHISYFRANGDHYDPCPDSYRSFQVSRNGKLVFDEHPKASLLTLPNPLIGRIVREIAGKDDGILVDLDERDCSMWEFPFSGLLYTNPQMRKWAGVVWNNRVVLKMTCATSPAKFNNFKELRQWLTAGSYYSSFEPTYYNLLNLHARNEWSSATNRIDFINQFSFQLHVKVAENIRMKHVRISIMDFIRVTACTNDCGRDEESNMICITLSTRGNDGDKEPRTIQHEFSLQRLRKYLAKVLCYIVKEHPSAWEAECPEVFINAAGKPTAFRLAGSDEMRDIGNLQKMANVKRLFGLGAAFGTSTKHYMTFLWRLQSGGEALWY